MAVGISLSQYHPAVGGSEASQRAAQLRVDTTQIHPYMDIIAPLAWTAIASLAPDKAGKISLDQLGFKTPQATQGTSKILLTQGTGKLAVNVSKAASTSIFVKALNVIMQGAKIAVPLVSLPAISVPALSAFTEALSYWEDRTRFIMSGNLTTAVATQQALDDPDRDDRYIGLLSGDYLMVPQKHTDYLAKELPNLVLDQGYLVRKDADPNQPLQVRSQNALPGITYASMRVSVSPLDPGSSGTGASKSAPSTSTSSDSSSSNSKKSKKKINERPLSATSLQMQAGGPARKGATKRGHDDSGNEVADGRMPESRVDVGCAGRRTGLWSYSGKQKVTLLRKLPALVPLSGQTFTVKVATRGDQSDLARDLQSMLEAEITKGDSSLTVDDSYPSDVITCRIIDFAHPAPTVSTRPSVAVTKSPPKQQSYLRVTGSLTISFQARGAGGQRCRLRKCDRQV